MPRYIIEREVGRLTADELRTAAVRSNQVLSEMGDVTWVKSYVSEAEGKIYCEYEAPSVEAVRTHADRTGIPANRVSEVSSEITPAMFA